MPALVTKWSRQVTSDLIYFAIPHRSSCVCTSLLWFRLLSQRLALPPYLASLSLECPPTYPPKAMTSLLIGSVHEIQDRRRHSSAFSPSNTSSSEPSVPALLLDLRLPGSGHALWFPLSWEEWDSSLKIVAGKSGINKRPFLAFPPSHSPPQKKYYWDLWPCFSA